MFRLSNIINAYFDYGPDSDVPKGLVRIVTTVLIINAIQFVGAVAVVAIAAKYVIG